MLYVHQSWVETYRRTLETEWTPEDRLVADLQGRFTPTWQMRAGTAWHLIRERWRPDGKPAGERLVKVGEWVFRYDDCEQALAAIPKGVAELPVSWDFRSARGQPCRLLGTVDLVTGQAIHDHKTVFAGIDAKHYEPSLQWRLYLLASGATSFRYWLWDAAEPDANGIIRIKDVLTLQFWPYVGMKEECMDWLCRFVGWAKEHNLTKLLVPRRK